jgi:hypothetical protein
MPVIARTITAKGVEKKVKPADGKRFSLAELQKHVGGYVRLIAIKDGEDRALMYVDEDGNPKNLPINRTATKFFMRTGGEYPIVGTVLIVAPGQS